MKTLQRIWRLIAGRRVFMRSVYAETLLEDFFVAAVASLLSIRLFLGITGFPQVAIGGLHISHVLAGGVLMVIAMVILLAFINRSAFEFGAVIGGIGFGAFIDETGKFITSNNDYFYEPTIAVIYVAFVLLFFAIRAVSSRQALSGEECMINALEITKQGTITAISGEERKVALRLLEQCAKNYPGARELEAMILRIQGEPNVGSPLIARLKGSVACFYRYVTGKWWFTGVAVAFFALVSISALVSLIAVLQWSWALGIWLGGGVALSAAIFWTQRSRMHRLNVAMMPAIVFLVMLATWAILATFKRQPFSLTDWAQFVFPGISGTITIIGLLQFPISRLRAYKMFRWATLVSIFLTQVLSFYQYSFLALGGLIGYIIVLIALRYMITNEEVRLEAQSDS